MKKYKKFLAVLMVITMVFSVISCGKALEQGGTPEQNNDMPSTVQSDNIENNSGETKATNDVDDAVQVSEEDVKTGTVIEEDGTVRQTDTFVSEDGWVTFDVDAVVEGYDITELPIISVVPNHYDSAELEQISKAMARGNTIYGYTEEFTKDELLAIRKDYSDLIEGYRTRSADGAINATDEEIISACKSAYAHSFIRRMSHGYNTVISEGGGNLSQGQKQLLCIARAMLTNPTVLILDEATSSIDTLTEIRVQKAFSKMMKGKTSFVVAHRLSTIKECDVILVMKDGNIIEQGNHEELLKQNGFYTNLYNSQFSNT